MKSSLILAFLLVCVAWIAPVQPPADKWRMPYKKHGFTKEQAAAHLLSRFSFGATPGQIQQVAESGLESWFEAQLNGQIADPSVTDKLSSYTALTYSNETIANTFLQPNQVIQAAIRAGVISRDSLKDVGKTLLRPEIRQFAQEKGYQPLIELHRQLINQKIIRAAYSNNQLKEVLTDFWFNHFNVSLTKNQSQQFVLTYERDAIRPFVTGQFAEMLLATAKHPAMLEYLDNASSVSNDNAQNKQQQSNPRFQRRQAAIDKALEDSARMGNPAAQIVMQRRKAEGLNENYAREIMELHTLGVDGGYQQKDVTEVARALTGWTIYPLRDEGGAGAIKRLVERFGWDNLSRRGFVREGDFLFRADKHDEGTKTILGKTFDGKAGYQEGVEVIRMLATHPSTASFICKKLAVRFVRDTPPPSLINKMSKAFLQSNGNIRETLIAMVSSDEFWNKANLREKIKSPFEFAISAVRATNADIQQPFQLFQWCTRMGQRFYYYQAPTGFPDKSTFWINTGSLLNRMNFGLAFASGKIPGIKVDLPALNQHREPESADEALDVYSKIFLPERPLEENNKRLKALVNDANAAEKINQAAAANTNEDDSDNMQMNRNQRRKNNQNERAALSKNSKAFTMSFVSGNNSTLAQVAGIIIGSPEFQRR
ncbi:MAG TPA: DUF1800 domain-containing protein [Chitinophagaceae bacterium]|nr:DUF1800 domain-containing protein [Chitinophagaceae bacterium]